MADIWFLSDTHFGHEAILTFTNYDGTRVRPFGSMKDMHDCIFDNWNETVKPQDKIYHLGDLGMGVWGLAVLREMVKLPGKKRLVLGNHDKYNIFEYAKVFQQIHGAKKMQRLWLSHCPIHQKSITGRSVDGNAHGHLHNNTVGEPGYFNCSVERIDYRPIHYEEIIKTLSQFT